MLLKLFPIGLVVVWRLRGVDGREWKDICHSFRWWRWAVGIHGYVA